MGDTDVMRVSDPAVTSPVPVPVPDVRPLSVVEVFGPTWQGEGPSTGTRAMFVRLAGCNLHCSWCDTPYSWDWTRYDRAAEVTTRSTFDLCEQLRPHRATTNLVVLTGGEPLLQVTGLTRLASELLTEGWTVEVETNGTRSPAALPEQVHLNVSPKLAHSNAGTEAQRIRPATLAEYRDRGARWKFVVAAPDDLAEVTALVESVAIDPLDVWIMPEGVAADALADCTARIAPAVLAAGYNLSTRLHVLAFGDERGT